MIERHNRNNNKDEKEVNRRYNGSFVPDSWSKFGKR